MGPDLSTSSSASQRTALVGDVMSAPLVTCLPGVPLPEVAALMTDHRIHAVVVLADPSGSAEVDENRGVTSELDLVAGACMADADLPAGRVAATRRRWWSGGRSPSTGPRS
jgi:signal-transduction protein with cAMP-binding, CBS, and nucleotidyltransferase domain